jgi:hypothetical protein
MFFLFKFFVFGTEDENKHVTLLRDKNCSFESLFLDNIGSFYAVSKQASLYLSVNESCFHTSEVKASTLALNISKHSEALFHDTFLQSTTLFYEA